MKPVIMPGTYHVCAASDLFIICQSWR